MDEAVLRAVLNPTRREILRLVDGQELTSGEIARRSDVTWAAVSQNLAILKGAGLVRERREGRRHYYRADANVLRPITAVLRRMWEDDLDRLARLAEAHHGRGRRR